MENLKIISWNVNGLNSARKRRQVMHWLAKQNCNVISLQETHVKNADVKCIISEEFYSLMDKKEM